MKVSHVPIRRINPAPYNPRMDLQPGDPEYEKIRTSMEDFGLLQPLVWNRRSGNLVGGHQRLKVLLNQGKRKVPVVAVDLPPEREKALNLALNRVQGSWDERKLAELLDEMVKIPEFDVGVTGFDTPEIADLVATLAPAPRLEQEEDFDLEAELARSLRPVTKRGNRIKLGRHTLLCGDSADSDDVRRLVDGQAVHLLFMDPPYGVNVEPRSNNAIAAAGKGRRHHQGLDLARDARKRRPTGKLRAKDRPLANDFLSPEAFKAVLRKWFKNGADALLPGRSFYFWGGYANCANYPPAIEEAGLYFSQAIIWHKQHPVLTRKDFMGDHEWAFYGWKLGAPHYFAPKMRNVTDVWSVPKVNPQSMVHLTEKPVELGVRAMTYSSRPGENVLDLFGGSGSTLVAAERTGRTAFLMEIDPAYCDVIVRRYLAFAGPAADPSLARKYVAKEAANG